MVKISINKDQASDPFYRYKMDEVLLKYEGQGNGQRTVFLNINDIAISISKDPELILSYLITVLGCKCIKNKEDQCVLYGTHVKDVIQNSVYDFISVFVLCVGCKNPETEYFKDDKNNIFMKCKACPHISCLPNQKSTVKGLKQILSNLNAEEKKNKKMLKDVEDNNINNIKQ
jgi:translation initiation factor 5